MGRQDEFSTGSGYYYRSNTDIFGNTSVAAHLSEDDRPIGSMEIFAGPGNPMKSNYPLASSYWDSQDPDDLHHMYQPKNDPGQIPGQIRAVGGVYESAKRRRAESPDKISWLHMEEGHPRALMDMLSVGITQHGSLPVADSELSNKGSAIAKAAARRYGIKGHPENPQMKPTFESTSGEGTTRETAKELLANEGISDGRRPKSDPTVTTSEEAKAMSKTLKANTPKAKAKRRKAEKERIARGKAENVQLELDI